MRGRRKSGDGCASRNAAWGVLGYLSGLKMVRILIDTEDLDAGWKLAGAVSVDTGRIIISDPCYLRSAHEINEDVLETVIQTDFLTLCEQAGVKFDTLRDNPEQLKTIAAMRKQFGAANFVGSDAFFVASITGFGDGRYPVFAKVENDRVVGLWIDFECGSHVQDDENDETDS
ncbi:hypothetical protein [Marivita sp.]|uniref:hypothetical protein n=1 Tax=Marivita sp. TaxID=2003365 RepID=UPI003B59B8B7